ncbi:hypothetical protein C5167_041396 [Papaver somniferum]|nr:hypothetical protein C5167_041396 [Papaver somniferum]
MKESRRICDELEIRVERSCEDMAFVECLCESVARISVVVVDQYCSPVEGEGTVLLLDWDGCAGDNKAMKLEEVVDKTKMD